MRKTKGKQKDGKVEAALKKSPINYFSDLFVAVMVVAWVAVIIIMIIMAIYTTIVFCDTSIWSYIDNLVTVPLSCGGAIWMVKNSVQHAIANNRGEQAHMDFPRVNADGEDDGKEVLVGGQDEDTTVLEDAQG